MDCSDGGDPLIRVRGGGCYIDMYSRHLSTNKTAHSGRLWRLLSHLPLLLYLLTCPGYYAGLAAPRLGITLFNPQLTHMERLSYHSSPFLHSLHGRLVAVLWYVVVIDILRFLTQSG